MRLTGPVTTALGVLHAIRRSDPALVSPIGWPVEVKPGKLDRSSKPSWFITIILPDLNRPDMSPTNINFLLYRERVEEETKYAYRISNDEVRIIRDFPEYGHHWVRKCKFVSNTYAHGDDFVVPIDTPEETETHLMQVSTEDLRRWIRSHPLKIKVYFS